MFILVLGAHSLIEEMRPGTYIPKGKWHGVSSPSTYLTSRKAVMVTGNVIHLYLDSDRVVARPRALISLAWRMWF